MKTGLDDPNAGRTIGRYLGFTMREVGDPASGPVHLVGTAPASPYLRSADGGIAMGALLALADSIAGLCGGLAALPGWVVSTNLMLRSVRRTLIGPIGLESTVLRAGRRATVTSVTITDQGADDALVADGALTSAVLEPAGGAPDFPRPLLLVAPPLEPDATPHLTEFLGTFPIDATTLGLEITDELRNPWGILHGGVTAALIDSVGCHATGGAATTDCVAHFLRPGRNGPVTASATRLGHRPDGDLVRVEVRDQGNDNRLMTGAITTVR